MDETVFLEDGAVKVTNSRFIISGKTYALAAVNSFRVDRIDETPNREIYKLYVFGLVIWALFEGLSKDTSAFVMVVIAAAAAWSIWWGINGKEKIKYVLLLTTSSGESEALSSYVPGQVQQIESALTQAVVHRG